ncbi:MAG: cytochrome b/b6 domain-containing protein [Deltaproteobacteria bacterium]|nr:cytochrome b/b6 domain-containing protein [Deltaproteobacteria bacterium]
MDPARPDTSTPAERSAPELSPAASESVLRFDVHQRLQHALMALSFTVLVLTGWPLSAHGVGASHHLVKAFGGLHQCGVWHRVAAVVLMVAAVYHLAYLASLLVRGRLRLRMLPRPRDLVHLFQNLAFFMGLRRARPAFDKYSYFEKFDYWAVFWGMVIMAGSGLVRWFPEATVKRFPVWVYEVSYYAHADEAILAALAIFVWHFYNVHLRPSVFPMSRVFLTGRLTLAELKEEHRAEYDELMASRAAAGRATGETPSSHEERKS